MLFLFLVNLPHKHAAFKRQVSRQYAHELGQALVGLAAPSGIPNNTSLLQKRLYSIYRAALGNHVSIQASALSLRCEWMHCIPPSLHLPEKREPQHVPKPLALTLREHNRL